MADLRALHERLGHHDVRTYLQSGNVVFRAASAESRLVQDLEAHLADELGVESAVVLRSAAAMAAVVAGSPFASRVAGDPSAAKSLHVTFLAAAPPANAFAALDPAGHAPDELVLQGREVHLWCPGGYGRTRLTPAFLERRSRCAATDRGWNTVVALADLAADPHSS
jgi:uncharacterized protein (DUF1697 family)